MRVLIVEDDDAIAEPLAKGLEREGLEVDRVETGRRRARPRAASDLRRRAARPRPSRPRRLRRVPRAARPFRRADHRGDRAVRGGRPGRRARARRRRLHRQAVRLPRAGRAHPRRRASSHAGRSATDGHAARERHVNGNGNGHGPDHPATVVEVGTLTVDRRTRAGHRRRRRGRADAQGVRPARVPRRRRRRGATRARSCSRTCGTRTGTARPRRSTCTSRRCARSSAIPGWIETVRGVGFRLRARAE